MVTDAKFSIPNESTSRKPHFLFRDNNLNGTSKFSCEREYWYFTQGNRHYYLLVAESQLCFMYLQHLTVPRFMRYTLTNKEDSVKVGSLIHDGDFHQEGLYGDNVIDLCPGFIHEDALVNEVVIVLNTFGNELAKTDMQYPNGDTKFPG
ncbi:uncharacterized protein A4U43_C01F13700 [Asparagus officinalis]|uniref:Uncharacterized protein n=1 Tax=Asparagus officinalis TaxID=4686 RepID=A0A5P1FPP4_ASPOF|nr:uncharacterized protein A4U43_C01F13700 [Asparagus officinalis]